MTSTDELLQELDEKLPEDSEERSRDRPPSAREAGAAPRDRTESGSGSGLRDRLPSLSLFSIRGLLVALALTVGGFLLGGLVPLVGGLTGLVGVFAAGFLLGVVGRRWYLELAVAGASTAAVGLLVDRLVLSFVGGFALPLAGVGAAAGLVAAVLGHYLGRDLHDGLTREV